jgi:secreted trypsin-like serine protease
MRKLLIVMVAVVLLAVASPAMAVKYGVPDAGAHPFVGLIVFFDKSGVPQWRCTGTLISPQVVVTAAHCTELAGPARIWFDEDVTKSAFPEYPYGGGTSFTGTAHPYPGWKGALLIPDTGDAGVVVLDKPVNLSKLGISSLPVLAPDGYLDTFATQRGQQNVTFTVVGYGLQEVKPNYSSLRIRMKADVQLVNLRNALTDGFNIQTSNDPGNGTGGGGTCFGDSGGPIFHNGNQIVAVNSFVLNENCAGASFGYRVDRAVIRNWILSWIK